MAITRTTVAGAMTVEIQLKENLNIKLKEAVEITESF